LLLELKPGQEIALKGRGKDVSLMGYVISGSVLLITEGDTQYLLKKGDSILFTSLCPHTFRNHGSTPFRVVWSLIPLSSDIPEK